MSQYTSLPLSDEAKTLEANQDYDLLRTHYPSCKGMEELIARQKELYPEHIERFYVTAVYLAAASRDKDMILLLFFEGWWCVTSDNANLEVKEIKKMLLMRGPAGVVRGRTSGMTALDWAMKSGNLPMMKLLLKKGIHYDDGDGVRFGWTALHLASLNSDTERVALLLLKHADPGEEPVDINAKNKDGDTALHIAARGICHYNVAARLVQLGADLETRSSSGQTPILCAAASGNKDTFLMLASSGAEEGVEDQNGETALRFPVPGCNVVCTVVGALVNPRVKYSLKDKLGIAARVIKNRPPVRQSREKRSESTPLYGVGAVVERGVKEEMDKISVTDSELGSEVDP